MKKVLILAVVLLAGCASVNKIVTAPLQWMGLGGGEAGIDAEELLEHVSRLASDEFEGRLPGSRGEEKTVAYLIDQFKASGAQPGNPDGSYVQAVGLAGIKTQADVGISVAGKPVPLQLHKHINISSNRLQKLLRIRQSPIVFVGYGVQAPEYNWDDYKGLDVRGKTLLMLVNDPQVVDTDGELTADSFKGRAMTYYGRWTYKHEIAAKLGAAAALVIHETGPAGYPWSVVQGQPGKEHFTLDAPNANADKVPVKGWIRDDYVRSLLTATGHDFDRLKAAAIRPDFRPVELPGQASFQLRNEIRKLESANVVAKVPGTTRPQEAIIYTAHWDHLGRNRSLNGDQIYNGAVDNATGTAGLLELAQSIAANPMDVSVIFLAVTAEEQGLLGTRHYVENPLMPLEATVANINIDAMNTWGATRDVVLVGKGHNTLEKDLRQVAGKQGRTVRDEPTPEKGFYFRSDHFEFARKGVPALYALSGTDFGGQGADYGKEKALAYIANDYHQLSDEVKPDWDLSGMVLDLLMLETVARQVAANPTRPSWYPSSEFAPQSHRRHP